MKTVNLLLFFLFLDIILAFECRNNVDQNSNDFCEINGYNRNDLPPYPPLRVMIEIGDAITPVVSYIFHFSLKFFFRNSQISGSGIWILFQIKLISKT